MSSATGPNPMARGLKTSRSFTIGVLIPDLTNPLFPPIVRGIDDRLAPDGYTPLLVNTDSDPERERASIEAMLARQVDGFIAATARLDVEPLAEAIARGLPVVLVNRTFEDGSMLRVTVDDRMGSRLAVRARGRTRARAHRLRRRAAERLDRPPALPRVPRGDGGPRAAGAGRARRFAGAFTEDAGAGACAEVLAADPQRHGDHHRQRPVWRSAATTRSRRTGSACPDDVSIVGFNDMLFIDQLQPPLTLGARAAAGDRVYGRRPAARPARRRTTRGARRHARPDAGRARLDGTPTHAQLSGS